MLYLFLLIFFCSLPLILTLVELAFPLFLTTAINCFLFFFQRDWFPLVLNSRSSSFCVIHVNVDIEIKSKGRIGFCCCWFLSLKGREAMRFTAETRGCLKCQISSWLTWRGGRTYRRFSQNQKFLACIDYHISLPMVLRHARFASARAPQ